MRYLHLHPSITPRAAEALLGRTTLDGVPLTTKGLASLARDVAAAGLWRPAAGRGAWRARLLATPGAEVWAVGWDAAQATGAHDHRGAAGALCVAEGLLVEECLDATMWTTCRRTSFASGRGAAFGPDHVHLLRNGAPGPSVSVHAYSPPPRPADRPAARPAAVQLPAAARA